MIQFLCDFVNNGKVNGFSIAIFWAVKGNTPLKKLPPLESLSAMFSMFFLELF